MENLTVKQTKVARIVQKDINIISYPFKEVASSCGLSAGEVLSEVKELLKKGIIRKFGAYYVIKGQASGKMLWLSGQYHRIRWKIPAKYCPYIALFPIATKEIRPLEKNITSLLCCIPKMKISGL